MRFGVTILGLAAVFAVLWLMWPSSINPVYWDEPEPPAMAGPLAPNAALDTARFVNVGASGAARSIALGPDGALYYGNLTGEVVRIDPAQASTPGTVIADFDTAPVLGLSWINAGTLGATTANGLFAVNTITGSSTQVSAGVPGYPFGYANDLAVTPNGEIYFTDSSVMLGNDPDRNSHRDDMLENRPHGALYVWDPRTHQTRLAADRLYFPNGLAVASDRQSIYIAETFRYRILRYWVDGPRRGESEVFVENLPGLPDGLATDGSGHLFIAFPAQRDPTLRTIRRNPWLARIVSRLPRWVQPTGGRPNAFIAVINEQDGTIISSLHGTHSQLCHISNMTLSVDQELWFGSADCGYIAQLPQAAVQAGLRATAPPRTGGTD
ncbi:hypothetical protein AWH62_11525 [Maricaulis sp. W15]|uniref:SMP-30/gluconolactonase/LRE family protein n=1 Tax=Maricaulis sp. W15 TaxID=1772333 RepID=UPI000948C7E2|nr:SMP-30/gluconolactonase/LRE family protein [Maricaulis sp. W15]OLF71759.1 hypothetical protein AWH62_11525 [Maricaulis sp. W15]